MSDMLRWDHDKADQVREMMTDWVKTWNLPSLAVGMARNGDILFEEAVGWADRERRLPATPQTTYALASLTKPMTAVGVMRLVQQRRIDLEKPINDYLGGSKLTARVGHAEQATVSRVLDHTAGLPIHYQYFFADETPATPPPRDLTIARYGNIIMIPGERYRYSNIGYGILDRVIERVGRLPYDAFMRQEVFLPCEMESAGIGVLPGTESLAAAQYGDDARPFPPYAFDHPGGSSARASLRDLLNFARSLMAARSGASDANGVLTAESVDRMWTVRPTQSIRLRYALGWGVSEKPHGQRAVFHNGEMAGASTSLTLYPDAGLAIVVLCNAWSSHVYEICHLLAERLFPDHASRDKSQEAEKHMRKPHDAYEAWSELAGHWVGHVSTPELDQGLELWIRESGAMEARMEGSLKAVVEDSAFTPPWLTGKFMGRLWSEDAARRPYDLELDLRLRGKVLMGGLTTAPIPGRPMGAAPDRRPANGLTFWTELRKTQD